MMKLGVKSSVLITLVAVLGCALVVLSGCKKEIKTTPIVTFFQPSENSFYDFGDTIWVEAKVSHPNISAITLTLVNDDFQPVEPVLNIKIKGTEFRFTDYVVIANKNIESGKHSIRLQVVAEGESYNHFVAINIGELQKQRLAIYASCDKNLNSYLYKINANGQKTLQHTLFGDVSGIATNSYYNQVYMAPFYYGGLNLFAGANDSLIWSENNNASNGAPFMHGVYKGNENVFGLYHDGRIAKYGNYGGVIKTFQLPNKYYAIDILEIENYLLVVAETPPQLNKSLFFFSSTTGSQIRKIDLPQNKTHIDLLSFNATTVAVLYNNVANEAQWEGYLSNGTFINLPSLPNFTFTSAAFVNYGEMALGTQSGIYQFKYSPLNFLPVSQIVPSLLVYDSLSNQLLIGAGNSLNIHSYPALQLLNSYSFTAPVKSTAILYNK